MSDLKLGNGWHGLESDGGNYWRWSTDNFSICIPNKKVTNLMLRVTSTKKNTLVYNDQEYSICSGINNISVKLSDNRSDEISFKLIEKFIPSQESSLSLDSRVLGISLVGASIQIGSILIPIKVKELRLLSE